MHRIAMCFAVLTLLAPQPLTGQEESAPAHVYEAYYQIGYGDLEEWNRQYWEYSVPVLEALQEEGVIEGWNQWQHQTGSEYNVRFAVRTSDWASINTFWGEYLSRLQEATPADEWDAFGRMIAEHRDEIWDIGEVHVPPELETAYLYASTFRLSFADMEEWDGMWTDVVAPILDEAMAEGTVGGWVKLGHNTGGPHNSKVLYFFEDWDDIDDLFGKLLGTIVEKHPDEFARINELFQAHDDVIWVPTTRDEM